MVGIGGFTLYSSPKIIGDRKGQGIEEGTVYGGPVLEVLNFTLHRK